MTALSDPTLTKETSGSDTTVLNLSSTRWTTSRRRDSVAVWSGMSLWMTSRELADRARTHSWPP